MSEDSKTQGSYGTLGQVAAAPLPEEVEAAVTVLESYRGDYGHLDDAIDTILAALRAEQGKVAGLTLELAAEKEMRESERSLRFKHLAHYAAEVERLKRRTITLAKAALTQDSYSALVEMEYEIRVSHTRLAAVEAENGRMREALEKVEMDPMRYLDWLGDVEDALKEAPDA